MSDAGPREPTRCGGGDSRDARPKPVDERWQLDATGLDGCGNSAFMLAGWLALGSACLVWYSFICCSVVLLLRSFMYSYDSWLVRIAIAVLKWYGKPWALGYKGLFIHANVLLAIRVTCDWVDGVSWRPHRHRGGGASVLERVSWQRGGLYYEESGEQIPGCCLASV